LVRSISDDDTANFLRAAYEVTEKTLRDVLGVRDRNTLEHQHTQAARKPLDSSYRVVAPQVSIDQVVLSERTREGIQEILWQVREGRDLYRRWGMERVLEKGKGTIVLFAGPPGTGKTMTAEAMAHELGRPLFVADYSELESKWIGETEKNIVRTFREAARARAVLLLDEADAILSTRLDGGHYNDRAYNRQVSLLLTEIEAFEGLCLLTTNRAPNLDDGLARRISGTFTFDVPGPGERLRIWNALLPSGVPVAADVDLDFLAHRFPMAGGHIKNAIITAIRKAAMRGGARTEVSQRDFTEAAAVERRSFRAVSRPIGFGETPLYAYG
jgi:SpoVK/Ycf46/Vps4 family AAA+-type ATPase